MGTWNIGIFDDDLAMDISAEFNDLLEQGLSIINATKQIMESFEDDLVDEDEGPIVYLVLASLQLEKGHIQLEIKKKALEIIENGHGLDRWKEAGEEELNDRIILLNELREKLLL